MDRTILQLLDLPRRFPGPVPLRQIGVLPQKTDMVDRGFDTVNYSFILRGNGIFRIDQGPEQVVEAPCMISKRPGPIYHYGPTNSWDEYYLMYDGRHKSALTAACYLQEVDGPCRITQPVEGLVLELVNQVIAGQGIHQADRFDRLADRLLMETYDSLPDAVGQAHPSEHAPSTGLAAIAGMRKYLNEHSWEDHNLDQLAARYGLSSAYARKLWRQHFGISPVRYVAEVRHGHACQLLVNSTISIAEIGRQVGYQDPQYFARRFKALARCTPGNYRRRYAVEKLD